MITERVKGTSTMDNYKRLTNNNIEEYNPKYHFCVCCEHYGGKYCSCNKPYGPCANYKHLIKIYNRLSELEDKIENGTLIELPCKIGQKIYWKDARFEWKIEKIEIYEDEILLFDDCNNLIVISDIGTKVFLTKPEAEAKLK